MQVSPPVAPPPPLILVVDDEPQIRDLLARVLEREGYRVRSRADGLEALEDLQREDVSILVSDLKMPRMGGLELIRQAKGIRPQIGTILVTAYASTETAVDALRQGVDDFISKPFGVEDLRRVVGRVLAARRLLTQERDALDRVREEAEGLRRRSLEAETLLETTRQSLSDSQVELEQRVRDLEFLHELTRVLSREEDLERILGTAARILAVRFQATAARLEIALEGGHHVAEHRDQDGLGRRLAAIASDLVARARREGLPAIRDVLLGFGPACEVLAAPLDASSGPAGGVALMRPLAPGTRDLDLLAHVPRALGVVLEAEIGRRQAVEGALEVATGILDALEGRGTLPRGHAERVARLAHEMAVTLGLSPRLAGVIRTAARLHDVGEVGVPDAVLQREGPLSDGELEVLKVHPILAARILAPFGEAAAYVRHVHERPDGQGYPDGLARGEIPLGAAIIAVAEAFDAMTHHRAYRPSRTRREALAEIRSLRDVQFDARAVDALLQVTETGA